MDKYTDETILTFGKHKGTKLANIPAQWFLWYEENFRNPDPKLIDYINENKMCFLQEMDLQKIRRENGK